MQEFLRISSNSVRNEEQKIPSLSDKQFLVNPSAADLMSSKFVHCLKLHDP